MKSFLLLLSLFISVFSVPDGYHLVWSDEFNGDSIDLSKWDFNIGGDGWGNNELEYYTNRGENAYVSNGLLHIRALKENYGGRSYTSARLLSKGKYEFTYGYIEARIALPSGMGICLLVEK